MCETTCHFATLTKTQFQDLLQKFVERRQQKMMDLLQQLPFFKHWSKTMLRKLLPSLNLVECVKGQILVQKDTLSDDVYLVKRGCFSGFKSLKVD